MFRFLHAADLHLDSPLRGLETYPDAPVEQIRVASRRALDNLVELAITEEVAFLVLAGDLFDVDWKDYHTALFFADRMGRLAGAGIPVHMVSGNHDANSVIARAMTLPENVHRFAHKKPETIVMNELGVALHGQGYSQPDLQDNLAAGYPPARPGLFNIGVLHTALTGRAGHGRYAPCSLDDLRGKGYQYWALGHIHQREIVCKDPWVVFSGCLQGRHIREEGPKGATMVTVEDRQVTGVQYQDLDVLRWKTCPVDISRCERMGELIDAVRSRLIAAKSAADGRPLAVRVTLTGHCRFSSRLQRGHDALHEEIAAITAGIGDIWLERVGFNFSQPAHACPDQGSASLLGGLIETLMSHEFSIEELLQEIPELEELKSKLPPELLSGEDPFNPTEPRMLDKMKEEVGDLLVGKFSRQNHGENS
jgi:DNA repair protein SbcD/Mre11